MLLIFSLLVLAASATGGARARSPWPPAEVMIKSTSTKKEQTPIRVSVLFWLRGWDLNLMTSGLWADLWLSACPWKPWQNGVCGQKTVEITVKTGKKRQVKFTFHACLSMTQLAVLFYFSLNFCINRNFLMLIVESRIVTKIWFNIADSHIFAYKLWYNKLYHTSVNFSIDLLKGV